MRSQVNNRYAARNFAFLRYFESWRCLDDASYSEEPRNDRRWYRKLKVHACSCAWLLLLRVVAVHGRNERTSTTAIGVGKWTQETEPGDAGDMYVPKRPRTRNLEIIKRLDGETRLTTSISNGTFVVSNFAQLCSRYYCCLSSFAIVTHAFLCLPQSLSSHFPLRAKSVTLT